MSQSRKKALIWDFDTQTITSQLEGVFKTFRCKQGIKFETREVNLLTLFDSKLQQECAVPTTTIFAESYLSPDAKMISLWEDGERLRVIEIPSGKSLFSQTLPRAPRGVLHSEDNKFLAVHDSAGVQVWELETNEELFRNDDMRIKDFAFSPDNEAIAVTVSEPQTDGISYVIKVWDLKRNTQRGIIEFGRRQFFSLSPDSKWILTSSGTAMKLWNAKTMELMREFPFNPPVSELFHNLEALAFSSDGRFAAVSTSYDKSRRGSWQTLIQLWDIATYTEIGSYDRDLDNFRSFRLVSFSDCGRYLETNEGKLPLPSGPDCNLSKNLPLGSQHDLHISGNWLYQGTGRLLWLPTKYRQCDIINGNTVVIGLREDRVEVLKIDLAKTPLAEPMTRPPSSP